MRSVSFCATSRTASGEARCAFAWSHTRTPCPPERATAIRDVVRRGAAGEVMPRRRRDEVLCCGKPQGRIGKDYARDEPGWLLGPLWASGDAWRHRSTAIRTRVAADPSQRIAPNLHLDHREGLASQTAARHFSCNPRLSGGFAWESARTRAEGRFTRNRACATVLL